MRDTWPTGDQDPGGRFPFRAFAWTLALGAIPLGLALGGIVGVTLALSGAGFVAIFLAAG